MKYNKNILVSIIVPVYNASKTISRLITSLVNQTYKNIEIILVDNNSLDDSLKLLKIFKKEYKKIKVFFEKKQGPSYARKKGFDKSLGDYIYFCDADDYLEKNAISNFIKCINKTNADVVIGNYNEFDIDNNFIRKMYGSNNHNNENLKEHKKIFLSKPSLWNKIFKKSLINNDSFVYTSLGEDICLTLLAYAKAENIRYIDKTIYNYIINENGLSSMTSYDRLIEPIKTFDKLKIIFIKNKYYIDYYEEINYIILTHILYRGVKGELLKERKKREKLRIKIIDYLENIDYKNNRYYKKSKIYKFANKMLHSNYLYHSYFIRKTIYLFFNNKALNKVLKKIDK